jgi:DNA-binding SARP family transcriptional activator
VRINVLGVLRVTTGDGSQVQLPGAKARDMFRLLVAAGARPVPVRAISEALWQDRPPQSALPNIQTYASRIRSMLTRAGGDGSCLEHTSGAYLLRLRPDEVDLLEFADIVARGRQAVRPDPAFATRLLQQAIALWHGPPLPAADLTVSGMVEGIALRWEELRISAYTGLVDAAYAVGNPTGLLAEVQQLASQYPYRESVQQLLLRVHYDSGDGALALAAYHRFRRELSAEMGVEPGPRLRRVYQAILREEPLDQAFTGAVANVW